MDRSARHDGVERDASPGGQARLRSRWLRCLVTLAAASALVTLGWYVYLMATAREPVRPTPIFQGVAYECLDLPVDDEGSGLAHIVTVDLSVPGVTLYVTPLDRDAVAAGHQYQLDYGAAIATREQLAVLVNGALFAATSRWWTRAGEWADGVDTVIAEHEISHVHPHSYLLWLEDDLTPHVAYAKPPADDTLAQARWAIGGQGVALAAGQVSPHLARDVDRRVILGIDTDSRKLWIGVFAAASPRRAAAILAERGARDAIMLDGGDSTTLVLGEHAATIPPGTLLGGYRPIATALGIRARPLE